MPRLITSGVSTARAFGFASKQARWIATLGGTGNESLQDLGLDRSGNIYSAGYVGTGSLGALDLIVTKHNSYGALQWQRRLQSASTETFFGAAADATGDVYVAGQTGTDATGDIVVAKYNTLGAIQWQRTLSGTNAQFAHKCALDSSDNLYVAGYTVGAYAAYLLVKYNSSGTLQWQRTLGGTATTDVAYGVAVDSGDNVYITGVAGTDIVTAKYDSSGAIQWQRRLSGAGTDFAYAVACDASDNVLVAGWTDSQGAGSNDILTVKYNSSGTLQWQRILGGAAADRARSVTADTAGNVYIVGLNSTDAATVKYNSSGTLQWQRTLSGSGTELGLGISILGTTFIMSARTSSAGAGGEEGLLVRLPTDGSLTGTYGAFTYAAGSMTSATSTLTDAAGAQTDAVSSLTAATATLTDSAATLTATLISI